MFSSLRVRLLALIAVALAPALAVFGYALGEHRRLLVIDARAEAQQLAQLVAELHRRPVDGARGLLLAVSRMRYVVANDPACSRQVAPLLEKDPVHLNIGALDPSGRVFCSAAPLRGPVDLADRRFFQQAVRTGDFGSGELVVSRIVGSASVGFGQAVIGPDGALRAVAFASLDVTYLQRRLDALALPPEASVVVLDRRGVVITSRGHPERVGQPFPPGPLQALALADRPLDLVGVDGDQRIHALQVVSDFTGGPVLQVVAALPIESVLQPVNRVMALSLIGFAAAALFSMAVAVVAGELLLVRRLRVLVATARRLSEGEAGARTHLEPGRDELGELIHAFDEMAASLQRDEEERRRFEEQLRQAQKMEAIGRLAGGVAHDFNNLLTVILGGARLLAQDLPADDPLRRDAADIISAGERAAGLTRQLLTFSRRQPLAPRVTALSEVVRSLERMLRRLLSEAITLDTVIDAPGRVWADPGQIEQVLVNLVVNARDALPEGGRITVRVQEEAATRAEGADPGLPAGARVVLSVEDTGTGMDAATQERVFEPFFSTKAPGAGTGLGLSTVFGIVSQSGGAIRIRSAPGAGTEFRVYLPRHDGDGPEAAPPVQAAAAGGRETILVVEDEGAVRALTRRMLEAAGYTVLEAAAPSEAMALVGASDRRVDLLLTDVLLHEENGLALSRRLRQARPGLRVAFMSGYAGGAHGVELPPTTPALAKPFSPDELLLHVRRALDGGAAGSGAAPAPGASPT